MRRNKIVKVSLSEQEYEKLVAAANRKGVSPSEFLRDEVKSLPAIHPVAPLSGERGDSQGKRAKLVWQALNLGKVSELKAAELLNLTVENLRLARREAQAYAIH